MAGKAGTQMPRSQPIRKAERFWRSLAPAANKTEQGRQKMKNAYVKLLEIASRVTGQAWKFSREIVGGVKRGNLSSPAQSRQATGRNDSPGPAGAAPETRERVLRGNTKARRKAAPAYSETHTEVIRKG